jgi:hypothetical protein
MFVGLESYHFIAVLYVKREGEKRDNKVGERGWGGGGGKGGRGGGGGERKVHIIQ